MANTPRADVLEEDADPTYSSFAHREEFLGLLDRFLSVDLHDQPSTRDDEEEEKVVKQLGAILDYYLPLPGLLDPSLEQIVTPLMEKLAGVVSELNKDGADIINQSRLVRLGKVMNWVVKVRGWKATVQHFPSSIQYLPILVEVLSPESTSHTSHVESPAGTSLVAGVDNWELRAVLLIWLALLLTVPFSLSAFSEDPVHPTSYGIDLPASSRLFAQPLAPLAQRVVLLSIPLLHRPGKEGAYASLVLARVYSRPDAVVALPSFFSWAAAELLEGEREGEANFVASLLNLLALLPSMLPPGHLQILQTFMEDQILPHLRGSRTAADSSLVRKLGVKARGRWWMSKLGTGGAASETTEAEGLEEQLDDLMSGLADKDTIVRYSSAKYLARIASALPRDFASQILMATIQLFQGTEDEPVVLTSAGTVLDPGGNASGGTMGFGGADTVRGEARWHGVCLAIAEMARRGLMQDEAITEVIPWVLKALTFDIRRATHSIGSNVRDAAAYVLWSISRASSPASIGPYAEEIATSLVSVACFDREVGVRRAASAAFQEGVGRLNLYPEGIDVLAKSDFYSVSVRRIAFGTAAPAVSQHKIYRDELRDHLHSITLQHWDEAMRTAGAGALRDLLLLSSESDLTESVAREISHVASLDANIVHGALSALAAIASSTTMTDEQRSNIFYSLGTIRPATLVAPSSSCTLISACDLISATVSRSNISDDKTPKILTQFIETTMRRREEGCHEAVAKVYARTSVIRDGSKDATKLISDLRSIRATQRQAAALCLGSIQYAQCPGTVNGVVSALLKLLSVDTKADVETRRYAIRSLANIVTQSSTEGASLVSNDAHQEIFDAFVLALADYSTDQRGDVGSWIRVAGLKALRQVTLSLANAIRANVNANEEIKSRLNNETFDRAIRGTTRLLADKLEPVRATAAFVWISMRDAGLHTLWGWEGKDAVRVDPRFDESDYEEAFRYLDQKAHFASIMPLLETRYRDSLVSGLTLIMGSQVDSVATMAFEPFRAYMAEPSRRSLWVEILQFVHQIMSGDFGSNRVFVPALHAVWRLAGPEEAVGGLESKEVWPKILGIACRGISQIKSIERITASLKFVMRMVGSTSAILSRAAATHVSPFLSHRFPRIRSMCAEQLYLAVSEIVDEMDPELEELLLETAWTDEVPKETVDEVIDKLRAQIEDVGA